MQMIGMTSNQDSHPPKPEEVAEHYASGYEADRLHTDAGQLEGERSRELLRRFLPPPPTTVLDVGGGAGSYAFWLARQGYEVHLIDIVPLHIQLAREASARQPEAQLASANVGDACSLSWNTETVDSVMLLGPLYHLTDRSDRLKALQEAYRVLKPGGILLAVGISRFASTLDGLRRGFLKDPQFAEIVRKDLESGQHRNPTGKPEYFMDTFFHQPDELKHEITEAGFRVIGIYGVEGPCWLLPDFDTWWRDRDLKGRLLQIARKLESEPSILGVSSHLLVVATK